MPEISIIVPVYNAEKYIGRCIDSISRQTFSDFEVILVDDGSNDRSLEICEKYAACDSRIHVIHQQNSGPSKARNEGLEWVFKKSESRYLTFIDSDDCFSSVFLERMIAAIKQTGADIAACAHRYIGVNDEFTDEAASGKKALLIDAEDLLLKRTDNFNYAWAKVFEKEIFRNLRYPEEVSFGEDNLIIYKALFETGKIAYLDEQLYYYFYNAEGITKSAWSPRSLSVFDGILAQLEYYEKNNYAKAYNKETELLIQQYAYQIHRICEDSEHRKANMPYLKALRRDMKTGVQKYAVFSVLKQNMYWYEAMHPVKAFLKCLPARIIRKIGRIINGKK